jgi:hypothetical protein
MAVVSRIRRGHDLAEVKEDLDHGQFGVWLEAMGIEQRMAEHYLRIFAIYKGKPEIISNLNLTAQIALAAPSTPDDVRQEFVRRVEAGEHVDSIEVKAMVARGKEERKLAMANARVDKIISPSEHKKQRAHDLVALLAEIDGLNLEMIEGYLSETDMPCLLRSLKAAVQERSATR